MAPHSGGLANRKYLKDEMLCGAKDFMSMNGEKFKYFFLMNRNRDGPEVI
jgi:hypothetical protein